ncbi:MAG: YraN family protein [Ignavibacteriales bacterium CG07_land_8_20_14_0_80_59_12]|jgi:putative endonuclease|nr:MAG: YraN family protein [Ignavibacteriales bacterium CG07_land_8_20_14_0_80_59_12]
MAESTTEKGKLGEDLAARFLEGLGYTIIERNYRYVRQEIDIVARDRDVLVFVEVKSRRSLRFGEPEDAVTERKRHHIRRTAEGFLHERRIKDTECRFDVVAIDETRRPAEIRHYINAFM